MIVRAFIIAITFVVAGAFGASAPYAIAAFMPAEGKFLTVLEAMQKQAGEDYRFHVVDMNKPVDLSAIISRCKANNVTALVLMDSKAIKTAKDLEKADSTFQSIPKFAFMTLMVKSMTHGLSNVAGITFEVPFYTVITNFRIVSKKDVKTVGVFYRQSFTPMIEESKKFLDREGIGLFPVCIDCDGNQKSDQESVVKAMDKSYGAMVRDGKIDAILVPADNLIVNSKSLVAFWIKRVKKSGVPVVAPLDLLASEKISVATFAADPDLPQLGVQAADMISDYFENGAQAEKIGFEPTISIKSTLNIRVAREIGWPLKDEKLGRITTIIK